MTSDSDAKVIQSDADALARLGYTQELTRCMRSFSNFAISLSIICILAGGITSFHLGYGAIGGAALGIAWPLVCLFSWVVALTMAQLASAFPTAGGLYHWSAILGGRGWGWTTAWFNLLGLITVLAAINVGAYQFCAGAFAPAFASNSFAQLVAVALITASQAAINHLGIRLTSRLTDLSGYLILVTAAALTVALLAFAPSWDFQRLWTFDNWSGLPADRPVWPKQSSLIVLFLMSFLLPAYTITGFDASAHTSEETIDAQQSVPRGIVRSVSVSGVFGWIMGCSLVLAIPDPSKAAEQGDQVFFWIVRETLPQSLQFGLLAAIALAQYLCGLATVTSASRMAFAFARDGGLPCSTVLRQVSSRFRSPANAIWFVAVGAVLFTVYSEVYSTITAVCVIFLYISYVLPTLLGFWTYGKTWQRMGPWQLGSAYRPLSITSVIGCVGLIGVGLQPPNQKAAYVLLGSVLGLAILWLAAARKGFKGPPLATMNAEEADHG